MVFDIGGAEESKVDEDHYRRNMRTVPDRSTTNGTSPMWRDYSPATTGRQATPSRVGMYCGDGFPDMTCWLCGRGMFARIKTISSV